MKKILLLILTIFLFPVVSSSQGERPPRFEDYPVKEKFRSEPAHINFRSCSLARMFRTMLRETVAKGANFAGHYGVKYWGCGTECQQIGIVDLRNGKVYMPAFAASLGVETRADSRLLILDSPAMLKERFGDDLPPNPAYQTQYYLWENGKLVLIYPTELKGKVQNILKSCEPK